jgi:hypothetical protein
MAVEDRDFGNVWEEEGLLECFGVTEQRLKGL